MTSNDPSLAGMPTTASSRTLTDLQKEKNRVQKQLDRSEFVNYAYRLREAQGELERGRPAEAEAILGTCEPTLRGWEMCSIGDALYGVPWVLGTRALFYNKTLFARAGLDSARAPDTWSGRGKSSAT